MKILYFILSLALINCTKQKADNSNSILEHFVDNESKGCLVIPGEGCGGCISEATGYFLKNKDFMVKENIHVVFTGIGEMKKLKMIVGKDNLRLRIVHIDSSGELISRGKIGVYPKYFSLKMKQIVSSVEFSPSENAGKSMEETIINITGK